MCLSAGNLPVVGLPAVTTKVCLLRRLSTISPLRGLLLCEECLSAGNLLAVGLPAVTTSCGIFDAIIEFVY